MRVSLYPATCVASLLVLSAGFAVAQDPAGTNRPPIGARPPAAAPTRAAPNGTNVAVVDISHIFKNHNRFNAALIALNERGAELDAWVRNQQRELATKREELGTYKAGSPEYQQLEETITKAIADNDLNLRRKKQDFLSDEAKLYYETYGEIEQTITRFALSRNIGLVLRHSNDQPKVEDPKSVMQNISRFVIFNNGLDITEIILKQLNAGTTPPPRANPTTAGGAPAEGIARPPATQPGRKLK
ncbi:MAG TPA: OmpH family outer membrane protein [Pirellulaceae bacterium]|nr:OmpH family outer membrane protein [Pirellulaceae bacterium]